MPCFVWSDTLPLVIQFPDDDDVADVADLFQQFMDDERTHAYFFGTEGVHTAVVVNFAQIEAVTVATTQPERAGRLPIYEMDSVTAERWRLDMVLGLEDADVGAE